MNPSQKKRQPLTLEDVRHIAQLARLALTEAEEEKFQKELNSVLEMAAALDQVKTDDLPETAQVTGLSSVVRADEPGEPLTIDEVLANAPRKRGRHFEVPSVL